MAFTFTDTHIMIVFLTKSDASEGFEQIIGFLNAHLIQYALMDLRLDDADNIDCLPNEAIFAELARMGYEKPSTNAELYANEDVVLETVDADVQGRLEESQAKVEEVIEVVTSAKLMTKVVTTVTTTIIVALVPKASAPRRRRGMIIQDPEEVATASRKPVTKAHARKNMMVYLKNMAGFKIDFFRGMTYIEIRPIFEKHYNSIQAFLEKGEKEIEEEGSKRKSESSKQRAAKKQRNDKEVKELKTHLKIVPNDEDDVYTKATPLALKGFTAVLAILKPERLKADRAWSE
nr:hypothetical protein [Tanacetum cinerariifolium]